LFVLVQIRLFKSRYEGANGPRILGRINKDAEMYLAFITAYSFFAMIMFLAAGVRFFTPVSEFYAC